MSKKYMSIFDDPQYDKYDSIFDDPQFDILNKKPIPIPKLIPKPIPKPIPMKIEEIKQPNKIYDVLKNMKYKQLQALGRFHNLHYHIKLNSRDNIINGLTRLYEYKNDKYGSKPFNMILNNNKIKQSVNITKRNKDDEFVIDLIKKQGTGKTVQDIIKNL
jgi:hypothetical protein